MDFYLSSSNAYCRLEEEYKKYGKLILAVDYDDTIYDFHKKGRKYTNIINLLRRWQKYADIIIWTGNGMEEYDKIHANMNNLGIKIYGINCDSAVKVDGRKIYANAYIDDRGGLKQMYKILLKLIKRIEKNKI